MGDEPQDLGVNDPRGRRRRPVRRRAHGRPPVELDRIDRLIIRELQEDGRRPYGRIGDAVGLSEAAVRQRVARLVKDDVIKIVAVTDPLMLGFRLRATVGLRTEGDLLEIADQAARIAEVDYVVVTAGSFDLLIEVQCEDDSHLFSLLNDSIRTIPGVKSAETFIYLHLHKQTYPWPPTGPIEGEGRR